jgi:hypothetical protein
MDLIFSVIDFIWEEIKTISESSLKSYGYAPYIMHMIERVSDHTFGCDKEYHPFRIKNDSRALMEERRAVTPQVSPPRVVSGRGQQGDKSHLLFRRFLACYLGCASPNML